MLAEDISGSLRENNISIDDGAVKAAKGPINLTIASLRIQGPYVYVCSRDICWTISIIDINIAQAGERRVRTAKFIDSLDQIDWK